MTPSPAWPRVPLAEAFWFQEGPGVRKWQFRNSGIKLLNVGNIEQAGRLNLAKTDRCLDAAEVQRKYAHFLLDPGDLVIASSGISFDDDGLLRTRGAFIGLQDLPLCLNTSTIRFKALGGISDLSFLRLWFNSLDFRAQITKLVTGTAQQNFGPSHLKATTIALPPLCDQRRIAEILDKAEALRAKRRAALAELDILTESIFREMFVRTLDGPAVDLSTERTGLPTGWTWEMLTDVACLATGHTPDRERQDYWDGTVPWISLTDIRDLDRTIATRTGQSVTPLGIANSSAVLLPGGTVCFSRTASVGFVTVMGTEMATSQDFVNWVCGERIDPIYLMWALVTARRRLRALSSGSTHKTIYVRVVEQFRVLLPPLELQRRFAAVVSKSDEQKMLHRASLGELDALFASLQHRAFSGEL